MLAWLVQNAATILISGLLIVIVALIVRGFVRGRIKTCSDCGSCGSACSGCQFHGQCAGGGEGRS